MEVETYIVFLILSFVILLFLIKILKMKKEIRWYQKKIADKQQQEVLNRRKEKAIVKLLPSRIAQFNLEDETIHILKEEDLKASVYDEELLKQISKSIILYPELLRILQTLKQRIFNGEREIKEVVEGQLGEKKGWGNFMAIPIYDNNGIPVMAICTMEDTAEFSEKEAELEFQISDILNERRKLRLLADMDMLTHVYNKCTTSELIDNMLEEYPDMVHAFVIIDLDNFKKVNDTLGHDVGDEVLIAVGKILTDCFRSTDIVGRVGGDEFVALVTDVGTTTLAQERAEKVRRLIHSGTYPDIPEYVSTSIGIAFSTGKVTFKELYRNADRALYEAKRAGKNQYKVYRE